MGSKKREFTCIWCGKKFTSTKLVVRFCSKSCAGYYRYSTIDKVIHTHTCQICGKEFIRNRGLRNILYCSKECFSIGQRKRIFGVGINDYKGIIKIDGKHIQSYYTWHNMIKRCYDSEYIDKHPTYKDCTVCDEWLYFSNFKKWFDENYVEGYQLDKDILAKVPKIYSPETCCFVPSRINSMLTFSDKARGRYPLGVSLCKENGKYIATCGSVDSKQSRFLGYYRTIEDAHNTYCKRKYEIIREVTQEALDKGEINQRIYDALLRYKLPE